MDWKAASAYYEARLADVLNVQRHALNLANLPQIGIPQEFRQTLIDEAIPASRQLERLKKREFRIAVVGLEKAGKSTFVNAWLDCDLLPAKGGRCTFTTTQIFSVQNDSEQRLEVQPRTEEQFTRLLDELAIAAKVNEKAKEDLETIQRHQVTLRQVRDQGNRMIPFSRLEDIKESLRQYVADEQFAHAVFEAKLYTSKLAQAEGIVFYDVPGLDSGLAKHVEESRAMLSDCDAVIVVQRFRNIRDAELQIIKFTEEGDRNITVADKLFVFLSNIDLQGSRAAMEEHIAEATADWDKRARLPKQRIVHGSAGAYLVLSGRASEQTVKEVGSVDSVQSRLTLLTGVENRDGLVDQSTGIQEIKLRVENYINTERVEVLQKRCETSIKQILSTSEEIFSIVRKKYSDNPEEAKRREENQRRIEFSQWWQEKWKHIRADLTDYYDSNIRRTTATSILTKAIANVSIQEEFHNRYLEQVDRLFEDLRIKTTVRREKIFKENAYPRFDSLKANYQWREELYAEISKMLLGIAHGLAIELRTDALKLIDYMASLLWNSQEVKERLIGDTEDFVQALNRSLSTLFLRFARPMVEALIRGPVGSETRQNIARDIGVDIEILDNYYSGEDPEFRLLKRFAKYGVDLLYDLTIREKVLGIKAVIEELDKSALTEEQLVTREVEADLKAIEVYLRSAIFEAAGFKQYCLQELDRLRDVFIESEPIWRGVALNEWLEENQAMMLELPEELRKHEVNLEVSERLRQLSAALKKCNITP